MSNLIEHPDHRGLYYDPSIVYIPTGDAAKDAEYRMRRATQTYSFPQKWNLNPEPQQQ